MQAKKHPEKRSKTPHMHRLRNHRVTPNQKLSINFGCPRRRTAIGPRKCAAPCTSGWYSGLDFFPLSWGRVYPDKLSIEAPRSVERKVMHLRWSGDLREHRAREANVASELTLERSQADLDCKKKSGSEMVTGEATMWLTFK